jgi:hypothetical protein
LYARETWSLAIKQNRKLSSKTFKNYFELADFPALPGYLFIPRSIVAVDISVITEPLPSYQQFLIVGFLG